jgi:hypothetical protein
VLKFLASRLAFCTRLISAISIIFPSNLLSVMLWNTFSLISTAYVCFIFYFRLKIRRENIQLQISPKWPSHTSTDKGKQSYWSVVAQLLSLALLQNNYNILIEVCKTFWDRFSPFRFPVKTSPALNVLKSKCPQVKISQIKSNLLAKPQNRYWIMDQKCHSDDILSEILRVLTWKYAIIWRHPGVHTEVFHRKT